jgi:glycogen operon protein
MGTLLLSQGVPMLLAGDEFLRTQKGNNNAWCQDNEISWVDWSLVEKNSDFLRFTREMIALRKRHPVLRRQGFFQNRFTAPHLGPEVVWHGLEPYQPDFRYIARTLALTLDGRQTRREADCDFYVAMNAWQDRLPFRVPPSPSGRPWRRVVDTALPSPGDIVAEENAQPFAFDSILPVDAFSLVVLISAP